MLKDITFRIRPGQRIGVGGRSGSGRSSLVSTLFRMTEVTEGAIFIDGIDVYTLSRPEVRLRLNALRQHPFLLPRTPRNNVGPL